MELTTLSLNGNQGSGFKVQSSGLRTRNAERGTRNRRESRHSEPGTPDRRPGQALNGSRAARSITVCYVLLSYRE
jgi:hypothetical protein